MESRIPEEELPESPDPVSADQEVVAQADVTTLQDGSAVLQINDTVVDDEADGSFVAFLSSLVKPEEAVSATPLIPSEEPSPKQETSFLGGFFRSETPVIESPKLQEPEGLFNRILSSRPQSAPVDAPPPIEEGGKSASEPLTPEDPSTPVQRIEIPSAITPTVHTPRTPEAVSPSANFLGRLFTTPNQVVPEEPAEPEPEESRPASPFSFLGNLFSPRASPPPDGEKVVSNEEKVIENLEPESTGGGFGAFLVSLVSGSGETTVQEQRRPSKLEQLADELVGSPKIIVKGGPPASHSERVQQATAFDTAEADDEVLRIEKNVYRIVPESKRLTRLLVAEKAEAELRLQEAEAAMRVLRDIRSKQEGSDAIAISRKKNLPAPTILADGKPSTETVGDGNKNGSLQQESKEARNRVDDRALKEATQSLANLKKTSVAKYPAVRRKAYEQPKKIAAKNPPHRAHHVYEPIAISSSSRMNSFPSQRDGEAVDSSPIPFSMNLLNNSDSRPDVLVASVEVRDRTFRAI